MIFWEHIKGLNISNSTKAWTYINFQKEVSDNTSNDVLMTCNPVILFGTNGWDITNYNKNYILTSHMLQGYIQNAFTFNDTLTVEDNTTLKENIIWFKNKKLYVDEVNDTDLGKWILQTTIGNNANALDIGHGFAYVDIDTSTRVYGDFYIQDTHNIIGTGNAEITGYCKASYFNATSDYRAKKDFKLLDINALELIKKVRLYSFKYKDSNQPSIGIIAQDVQDVNIDGFDLVDNKTATGENFDYMSIHESKLIYILWKAIQEQQKEIEELKQQLNK